MMDTSKEYIKMCEKAVEVQKGWFPDSGEFVFYKGNDEEIIQKIFVFPLSEEWTDWELNDFVWLPRQDQLQGMINKNLSILIHDFEHFSRCASERKNGKYIMINSSAFTSMEQLWLAFVMKEKYQKHWNGKDWVKQ